MNNEIFHRLESSCWNKIKTIDFSCQANQKQYRSTICTCRRHRKTQIVYKDNNSEQSSIDLGVERVKVVRRKKIIKVYLPENRGVLNVTKKLSSKCVGGIVSQPNKSEKLKITKKKDTSLEGSESNKSKTKISDLKIKIANIKKSDRRDINVIKKISNLKKESKKLNIRPIKTKLEKSFSSESSIERIYNLESSTSENSKIASHSNEDNFKDCNSLSLKNSIKKIKGEKPKNDLRSPTILEKANEILKQGLSWIRESSKDLIVRVNLSKASHKDVSITSSPPSLIARSLSSTKSNSPKVSFSRSKTKVYENINNKEECNKEETKPENVKTMFRLWEKKFNFEDGSNVPNPAKNNTVDGKETDIIKTSDSKDIPAQEHKKSKKIFSFFRKKNKDKCVNSFKGKKVTTGRCELTDGIVINIALDANRSIGSSGLKKPDNIKDDKNILQQSWLKNFITNSRDSRKSIQLRWDNKFYGTSSNTVSELKNYTMKNVILKSKSEISSNVSSQYDKSTKHNVNFKQNIKACMMPNTICQIPTNKIISTHINSSSASNGKKCKGKSKNHIEIFLPARHFSRDSDKSSEYVTIHIPEDYFSEDSEDQNLYTDDEEVYNIVEYESQKSKNILNDENLEQNYFAGDYLHNNTKEKRKTTVQTCREVVIQGSNVCVPNVIEVGVITQRDLSYLEKSMMKPPDSFNDKESQTILQPQRKCDPAESYLRATGCMPLGLDLFTSHTSKSQWQLISLNSSNNCSNCGFCNDNNMLSSKSSTDRYSESSKVKEYKQIHTNHFFSKLRKKTCIPTTLCNIRTCPKDSLEVCKKRKTYACSNKSKWGGESSDGKPTAETKKSTQSAATSNDETCMDPCADIDGRLLDGILKFKGTSDCSNCKNNEKLKHATVNPDPICQIPQAPCQEKCASVKKPPCTKNSSPTCHTRSPECMTTKSKVSQTKASEEDPCNPKSPQITPNSSHATCLNAAKSKASREVDSVSPTTCFCSGDENIIPSSESVDRLKALTVSPGKFIPPPMCPLDPNSYCCCKPKCNTYTNNNATITSPCENKTTPTFYQKSFVNVKRLRCNCIGNRSKNAPGDKGALITGDKSTDIKGDKSTDIEGDKNADNKKDSNTLMSGKPSTKSLKQSDSGPGGDKIKTAGSKISKQSESTKDDTNKIKGVNCDEILEKKNLDLVKDMYKDPCNGTKTPTRDQKSLKSVDADTIQRKLSVSDIIEINICLKFRNPEASKGKIKPYYAYNIKENSEVQNIKTGSSHVYQFYEKEANQIKGETEDLNFTINIQTVKPQSNFSNEHNLDSFYTPTILKRDNSINYSAQILQESQPALDFTNSANKVTFVNKQIANFEISCAPDFATSKTTNSSLANENVSENNSNITTENISESSDINSYDKHEGLNNLQEEFEKTNNELTVNESVKDIVNRKLVTILKKLDKTEKKEVLKQILETVGNMKSINKTKKVKRIKHLMYAVLTSESDIENVDKVKSTSVSSTNICSKSKSTLLGEILSEESFTKNINATQENGSSESNDDVKYVNDNIKEEIKKIMGFNRPGCCCSQRVENEGKGCCCNNIDIKEKNCCCQNVESNEKCSCYKNKNEIKQSFNDQNTKKNFKEAAIQISRNTKFESIVMTEVSTAMQIESEIVSSPTKRASILSSSYKNVTQTRQDQFVYLTSDKVLFFISDSKENFRRNIKKKQFHRPEDILQLRETKRAVLKIYSQRRISSSIIKLPKFVSYRQCRVRPYT